MSKAIKIRIAVAVDHTGQWGATGSNDDEDNNFEYSWEWIEDELEAGAKRYYVDAFISVPDEAPHVDVVEGIEAPLET